MNEVGGQQLITQVIVVMISVNKIKVKKKILSIW